MGKKSFSSIYRYFMFLVLIAFIIISFSSFQRATAEISIVTGDAALRIGALGGTVEVEDPLSALYKASVNIKLQQYRKDDSTYGYVNYQAQVDAGQTAGTIVAGSDNKVLQISAIAVETGRLSDITFGNILVLYNDSDSNGSIDQFPAYVLSLKNIDAEKKQITLMGEIPEGNFQIIQAVQTPEFSIQSVVNPFPWPKKIEGAGGKVLGVGPYVAFQIDDDANTGFFKIRDKRINRFDKKVKIVLPYDKDAVSALGLNTNKFRIYSLTRNKFKAVKVKKVKKSEGVVIAKVKHFTIYQVVIPFKENNSISYITDVKVKVKGKSAKIKYHLADANNDASDVEIEYRNNPSLDADTGWVTIATKKGIKPGNRTYKWNTGSLKTGYYQVRVTPIQKVSGSSFSTIGAGSNVFYIANGNAKADSPSGLTGTVDNDTSPPQVSLSWNARSSASSYNVYRQAKFETGGFEKMFRFITNTSSTSYTDTTIPKTFYEAAYQVTSVDSSGRESKFSNKKELRLASIVLSGYGGYYGYYGG